MQLTANEAKSQTVKAFMRSDNDTGSPEVQIAILTQRINNLTGHLKTNKNDNHSRRGLMTWVSRRRKLLDYLKKKDSDSYLKVISALEIRK
ncbi:MAG: 30S ribosomal protein S15 [Gammaproteobacteria bacterium]